MTPWPSAASWQRVKDFSPHDLRRTFVSDLIDAGVDLVTVAGLAGHAQRYNNSTL